MLKIQRRLKSRLFILSLCCLYFSTVNFNDRHLKYEIMVQILYVFCFFTIFTTERQLKQMNFVFVPLVSHTTETFVEIQGLPSLISSL